MIPIKFETLKPPTVHHLVQLQQYCNAQSLSSCTASTILHCALCIILYSFNNIPMRTAYHLEQLRQYCNAQCALRIILYSFNYIALRNAHNFLQLPKNCNTHCASPLHFRYKNPSLIKKKSTFLIANLKNAEQTECIHYFAKLTLTRQAVKLFNYLCLVSS